MQFLASYANHLAPNASPPSPRKHPTEGRCKYVFVCTKTLLAFTQKGMQLAKNRATTFPPVLLFPDGDTTFERRL